MQSLNPAAKRAAIVLRQARFDGGIGNHNDNRLLFRCVQFWQFSKLKYPMEYYRFLFFLAGTVLVIAIAWRWPRSGNDIFFRSEDFWARFASNKVRSILCVAALVVVIGVALLPLVGFPVPDEHDDFCYLLSGDTFAHGRLTNPPHPMRQYLDTFYVLQSSTYMSLFSPGQGMVLAIGQLFGHPWIGVLLSVACLCGALTWCLQAWVPARWALLGGIVAAAQFDPTNYWMESYHGGAFAAIGGALALGAFPRIVRRQRARDATLLALGIVILANTRPYEGVLFCIGLLVAGVWFVGWRKLKQRILKIRVLVPFCAVIAAGGAFIAYDNWRISGNPMVLPWTLMFRNFFSSPTFLWGKLQPPLHYSNSQFEDFFSGTRKSWLIDATWPGFLRLFFHKIETYLFFYARPQFWIAIMFSLYAMRKNRKILFCVVLSAIVIAGTLAVQTSFPHYLAPITAAIYIPVILGFRYLYHWKINGRPIGVDLVRMLVVFQLALVPIQAGALALYRHHRTPDLYWARMFVEQRLEHTPGKHLVIVRYAPGHPSGYEWVYNRADIDDAKVVWAREIPGLDLRPLLGYFKDRKVWLAEPDAHPPLLQPWQ